MQDVWHAPCLLFSSLVSDCTGENDIPYKYTTYSVHSPSYLQELTTQGSGGMVPHSTIKRLIANYLKGVHISSVQVLTCSCGHDIVA
ncbi:hypothetical protein EDD22DRAFT_857399 [Suillus occidentalis]|nr:hypothetical protein EDD22DRAFT_857399 [Suillus occidentalis]